MFEGMIRSTYSKYDPGLEYNSCTKILREVQHVTTATLFYGAVLSAFFEVKMGLSMPILGLFHG